MSQGQSSGRVRRIGDITGVLVASPDYLDRRGHPPDVSQLINLVYLQYRESPDQTALPLTAPDGLVITAPVTPAFAARAQA